ncbi:glycoside hydrolase N-terminal domain-containing protein [Streptomyces sp. NPDC093808]|uniref:glycosyl hydrolase family 95 catalytic domain-containing protein n=1 Tax=Streptomyces sp. NPDC093808 TaxID=3154985 RepID=UPI00344F1144
MPETADHSSPADPSRRAVLRGATALGALLALSALPEFTPRAAAAPRPPLSLVPADRAVLLRYSSPGAEGSVIEQGLPVGNGRLGALTTGGSSRDAFYLTDATLWTGHANAALDSAGQFPYDAGSFGTFGLLAKAYLDLPAHTSGAISGYRRTLDLSNGLVTASYTQGGTTYTREVYASVPDDVVVIRLAQSGGGSYTGSLTLTGTRGESVTAEAGAARVFFAAGLANSLRYAAVVQAAGTGGTLSAAGAEVTFTGCSEVVLVVSGGTDYKADHTTGYRDAGVVPLSVARTKAEDAAAVAGTALLASHVADHRRLQERMTVDLGASTPAQRAMDTPERLAARAAGATPDPELEAAYLQFGRYLTIRGSRGSLPTNLQGLWVDRNNPDWMADYHTDVNVQINYWLPDRAGLPECFDAFTDYCLAQVPGWTATTQRLFQDPRNGFRNTSGKVAGWTVAISTNIWGGNGWWWHPAGNAWICNSLYEHYDYTRDTEHLRRIHPMLKGACQFWEARLITTTVPDPDAPGGTREVLIDDHDWSPEHGPTDARGITYAQELVWQLFRNYRDAAAVLGLDADYASTVAALQERLYLPRVSATTGRLEEWMTDADLGEPEHRHLSPLVGLFPGDRIALGESPGDLVEGVTALLTARGMESYGWASAWRALCWARLKDADKAYRLVTAVMRPSVDHSNGSAVNLFDMYSFGSRSTFQIDANFGTPAAMIEMLVQSRPGRIELLPALPAAWAASGSVTGVGVRGGCTVDLRWSSGSVTSATVHGRPGTRTTVVAGAWSRTVTVPAAGSVTVTPGPVQLVNRLSGKAIDVPGASGTAGRELIQYTPSGAANQRFRFVPVGGGLFEVRTTHLADPLCWDIAGGSTAEGARLTQWAPTRATNQQWRLSAAADGHVTVGSVRSGKVLGVTGDSTANHATVEQQTADGGAGQQWRIVSL